MSSTLIVRDALSLVLGGERGPRGLEEHLRDRVHAVRAEGEQAFVEILECMAPTAGEDAQADVLSAALVLALAHPRLAQNYAITAGVHGTRLASRLERDGDVEGACGALRLVCALQPGNRPVERALATLMRRQGMVQDLVDRYLLRAQELLDRGAKKEAIPWLREVLQLDRSRKDVARTIRDLRFEEVKVTKAHGRRWSFVLVSTAVALGLTLVVGREVQLRRSFEALPPAAKGSLATLRFRLEALETFIERHPIWHGALGAMEERAALKDEIDRINADELARREMEASERRLRDTMADNARLLANESAQGEDFSAALVKFREAIEVASETWPHRARTERDIEAIAAHIAEQEAR